MNIIEKLLSKKGKDAFFPSKGILAQAADAKNTGYNATIGQAFEDNGDAMVLESFAEQLNIHKKAFLYSSSYGNYDLRKRWKIEILNKNPNLSQNITLPIVTNALTHGLSIISKLFLDDSDKIIIPDLFWGNYKLIFDSDFDVFKTFKENKFNVDGLEKKIDSPGKKVVLLNFPNNPTGYTVLLEEVKRLITVLKNAAKTKPILVILDDAYFGLTYEKNVFSESLFSKLADISENLIAVKIDGITKEYFAWGLRVGFITYGFKNMGENDKRILEDKTAGIVRGTISNVCNVSQIISLNAFMSPKYLTQREEKYNILKKRYEMVKVALVNEKYKEYFECLPFNSGYFMCILLIKNNANNIREILINKYNTGLIAIGKDKLRIAFSAISKEKIQILFENIYEACKNAI